MENNLFHKHSESMNANQRWNDELNRAPAMVTL